MVQPCTRTTLPPASPSPLPVPPQAQGTPSAWDGIHPRLDTRPPSATNTLVARLQLEVSKQQERIRSLEAENRGLVDLVDKLTMTLRCAGSILPHYCDVISQRIDCGLEIAALRNRESPPLASPVGEEQF